MGRSSCDNIIIAQEAIHHMSVKPGRQGYVAFKVDMEKAYDRLDWGFLEKTLQDIGINQSIIGVIMACVSITTMSVLGEGANGASFNHSRGVRQGDPLSPYLFVLCMERLRHLIQQECERGR